jgi:hypothetical protein
MFVQLILVLFFWGLFLPTTVDGDFGSYCDIDITTVRCNTESNVCAHSWISGHFGSNHTDYRVYHFLVEGLEEGQDQSDCPTCGTTGTIAVEWDQDKVCTFVSTDEGLCNSCTSCNITTGFDCGTPLSATFSADCSNLHGGRNVTCEPVFPVFYPFEPNTPKPTKAPTSCGNVGDGCSKSKDCCDAGKRTRCGKNKVCVNCKKQGFKCQRNAHCCRGLKCKRINKKSLKKKCMEQ